MVVVFKNNFAQKCWFVIRLMLSIKLEFNNKNMPPFVWIYKQFLKNVHGSSQFVNIFTQLGLLFIVTLITTVLLGRIDCTVLNLGFIVSFNF